MDCAGVASHLVAYHLATVADQDRDAIDAHLLDCTACLKTYLALKHATDRRPLDEPSPAVRARIRADVAAAFAKPAKPPPSPRVAILARRIPLYQGLFAAAVAAAIALLVPSLLRGGTISPGDVRDGTPHVDSARPRAESFQIY